MAMPRKVIERRAPSPLAQCDCGGLQVLVTAPSLIVIRCCTSGHVLAYHPISDERFERSQGRDA